jgi:L-asparaginase
MSEKIALIGFGGTIAMVPNAEGALAPAASAEELINHVPMLREMDADLEVIQLLNKDSTNVNPVDWELLIDKIAELQNDYDGIIVTHGTDTMPYTATATAFAMGEETSVPIVFTGSQLPIIDVGTDARVNLERSMKILLEVLDEGINETMIVFSDRVLRAARTIKINEAHFNAFDSPAFAHLADLTATKTVFSPLAHRRDGERVKVAVTPLKAFENRVVSVDLRPGLEPDMLRSITHSDYCAGLVLKSLGAGNVPTEGKYSLLPVIQETVQSGKPVIIATKFVGGKTIPEIYETGREALKVGAGHASNMTSVTAEVKLMWLMGQGIRTPEAVNAAMLRPYIGEVD